ncbi:hypothetical protein INR49_007438 [Caranx melampygus]|nr:hypothetical protein INR49_007438 [Caranx melampygus]
MISGPVLIHLSVSHRGPASGGGSSPAGVNVLSLCEKGDAYIMAETGKVFKKEKEMKKDLVFLSVLCGKRQVRLDVLRRGVLVDFKDLGVHVDGFIANVAHSFVVGATKENPITGRKADVIKAAHLCAEAALRLVKPGMLSHQLKQHVIDGEKTIIQNPTDQQRHVQSVFHSGAKDHEKAEFEVHEVYAVDVLISSGEGRSVSCRPAKDGGLRTTIYKRDPSKQYGLKMKTSREFVAQFKFTVLLMANGPHRITNGPFDADLYKSEHDVQDPELRVRL